MPYIMLDAGHVSYQVHGDGHPLVLLHANPGDSRDFSAVIPALSAHFRVITLDWPGYGESPAPANPRQVSAMFFAQVLAEFVAALALPPAVFIGNSVGGYAAAKLAADQPGCVAGLVLVSPGGFTRQSLFSRLFCAMQASPLAIPPDIFARIYLYHHDGEAANVLSRAGADQSVREARQVNRAVWRSFSDPAHDLCAFAPAIQQPTLLVFGHHDPVISARKDGRRAQAALPHAEFCIMDTGHLAFAEQPDAFVEQVLPFIHRVFDGNAAVMPVEDLEPVAV